MLKQFRILTGDLSGVSFVVNDGETVRLGRGPDSDIFISNKKVSRNHCFIKNFKGTCIIADNKSHNGTFVNGKKIKSQHLKPRDEIKLGNVVIRYNEVPDVEAEVSVEDERESTIDLMEIDREIFDHAEVGSEDTVEIEVFEPTGDDIFGEEEDDLVLQPVFSEREYIKVHRFCDGCGVLITRKEIDSDKFKEVGEKTLCLKCATPFKGRVVGQYRILGKLRETPLGAVYKARHEKIGNLVAIKVLFKHKTLKDSNIDIFLREAKLGATLNHPNLVKIFDIGEDDETYYFVMEYIEGEILEKIVQREGPVSPKLALEVIIQIGWALQYAFQKRLVHRDIRPGNIVLSKDNVAKLVDLGAAKSSMETAIISTVSDLKDVKFYNFFAPEQVFDAKKVDIRTDIYSLGATYFYLVTKQMPVRGNNIAEFIENVKAGRIFRLREVNQEVPLRICRIIEKMMSFEHEKRPQTPSDAIKRLTKVYFQEYSPSGLVEDFGPSTISMPPGEPEISFGELDLAMQIQRRLVPSDIGSIKGYDVSDLYLPAKKVGGDYFDFFPVDKNKFAIIIADVSGKGITGGMIMVLVRSIFRMIVPLNLPIKKTILKVNQQLYKDIKRGLFVSAIYGILDTSKNSFRFVNVGHNPLLVWRKGLKNAFFVKGTGMALGISRGEKFKSSLKEKILNLKEKDSLVFYTDGVVEMRNKEGNLLGADSLKKIVTLYGKLSADGLVENIRKALDEHRQDSEQNDDVTIFVLKFLGM